MNVITGGLGFIGNELVRQLLRAGEEVVTSIHLRSIDFTLAIITRQ